MIKKKQFIAFYSEIKELLYRRFLYIWQAVEIFLKDGKSYYLNFFTKEKFEQFIASVTPYMNQSQIINEQRALEKVRQYKNQWVNYQITNYEYLLKLNKYSTRTYKETNQYPVFPWVIRRYNDIINPNVIFSTNVIQETWSGCQETIEEATRQGHAYPLGTPSTLVGPMLLHRRTSSSYIYPYTLETSYTKPKPYFHRRNLLYR